MKILLTTILISKMIRFPFETRMKETKSTQNILQSFSKYHNSTRGTLYSNEYFCLEVL